MTKQLPLSTHNIDDARKRIDPIFLNSRLLTTDKLGFSLFAKDETDNPIRSFKGRGTGYFLAKAPRSDAPLVTASAGNFGQGLAFNAARHGRSLVVFASVNANPGKIEAMRSLGAEVRLAGEDFDAAKDFARRYAAEEKLEFIEDGADAAIAEGAGTIAAELTDQAEALDFLFLPLGNGALAAGMGAWIKAQSPHTRVIAVVARGAPCMALSWEAGKVVETPEANTIADGIAVRTPVPAALKWLEDTIDGIVRIDESQILEGMRFVHQTWGLCVEPSGGVGPAAILARAADLKGARVATVLGGANLTERQLKTWFSWPEEG